MKAYRVELLIIDHDVLGEQEITDVIENVHYPNHCIAPDVMAIESRDIGPWEDYHPLNQISTRDAEYSRLFHGEVNQ